MVSDEDIKNAGEILDRLLSVPIYPDDLHVTPLQIDVASNGTKNSLGS